MITSDSPKGIKESKGKTRWSLLPFDALEEVVSVLNFGAVTKYQPENWKKVECKAPYADAIIRHWKKYFTDKEEFDSESGLSNLAHMACDVLFLLWERQNNKDIDFELYLKELLTYPDYVKQLDENKFN